MSVETKTLLFAIAVFLAIFVGLLAAGLAIRRSQCENKWADSGFPHSWSAMGGCRINVNGRWIPASAYRELP